MCADCHVKPEDSNWWKPIAKGISENNRRIMVPVVTSLDSDSWNTSGKRENLHSFRVFFYIFLTRFEFFSIFSTRFECILGIKWVRHENNTGLINAKLQGGNRASGDIVAFLGKLHSKRVGKM